MDDSFDRTASVVEYGLTSILCVPVRSKNATLGVIYLENRFQEGVFDNEDPKIWSSSSATARAKRSRSLSSTTKNEKSSAPLANAVEARDTGTSSHVQRVSQYAVAVGSRLGLSPVELVSARTSGDAT